MTSDPTDARYLGEIRRMCGRLPETEEIVMWGGPLFRVRRRRYALFNGSDFPTRTLHVVTDPAERPSLRQDARFSTSPHHPRQGWMALDLDATPIDWTEVAELIESAYRQVASSKLIEALERPFGGNPP